MQGSGPNYSLLKYMTGWIMLHGEPAQLVLFNVVDVMPCLLSNMLGNPT